MNIDVIPLNEMEAPIDLRDDGDLKVYRRLVRDICYLYHDLAGYRFIMGDLDYAAEYDFPYWQVVNRIDTGTLEDRFIRGGILILVLAKMQDVFDGSGDSLTVELCDYQRSLSDFIPEDDEMLRLLQAVEHGLNIVKSGGTKDDLIEREMCWAYNAFVNAYFVESAARMADDAG